MNQKQYYVGYWNEKVKKKINKDIKRYKLEGQFNIAISNLKKNAECGNKIVQDLWPKEYKKNHEINNLWRYELIKRRPGWRMIYTILPKNKVKILSAILEVLDHTSYNRRFK